MNLVYPVCYDMYYCISKYRAHGESGLHAKQTGFTMRYAMTKGKFPYLCNAGSKLRRNYDAYARASASRRVSSSVYEKK